MQAWLGARGAALAFLLLAVAGNSAAAAAPLTDYESILFPGSLETHPWDINSAGVVAGAYRMPDGGGFHGFIYSAGVFTTIDAPGADSTVIYGINDSGEAVGAAGGGAITSAFKYYGGAFQEITIPGATGVVATEINNSGQVVGNYSTGSLDSGLVNHMFLLTGATITTLAY